MKTFLAGADGVTGTATICAPSLDEATQWARNYFGDYRVDFRNTNHVEFQATTEIGGQTYYKFSVHAKTPDCCR